MENLDDKIIIELYDESKKMHRYELLDIVKYNDKEYAVMLEENSVDKMVTVFSIRHTEDKAATLYKSETDNYIIMQVYEMFKEKYKKYYSDRIKFED